MEIIRLPERLPSGAELHRLNQRLHAGEITLDWSAVGTDVSPDRLAILLHGLDLSEQIERLGSETIPDKLMPAIYQALEESHSGKDGQADHDTDNDQTSPYLFAIKPERKQGPQPELWLPEAEIVEEEEEEPTMSSPQQSTAPGAKGTTILRAPTRAEMRDELEDLVIRDLLGPAGGQEEEVDEFRVHDRYLIGVLVPNDSAIPAEELDSQGTIETGIEDQGTTDSDASQTTSLSPSSIGMSFCVDRQATHIQVQASWGHYLRVSSQIKAATQARSDKVWKRHPRGGQPWLLPLRAGEIERWQPEPATQPEVYVSGIVRRSSQFWTVTLFLVNGQKLQNRKNSDAYHLFQPALSVTAPDGGPIFQRRPSEVQRIYKEEDQALAMLYRKHVGFAIGHGVSVHADTLSSDPTCAYRLTTRFIPGYEVPLTEAPTVEDLPALADLCLDMHTLSHSEMSDLPGLLQPLVTAYSVWIDEQAHRLDDPDEGLSNYQGVAQKTIQHCRDTLQRIAMGISLLQSNTQAAEAFRFMNRSMWLQRIHTLLAEDKRRGGDKAIHDFNLPAHRSWRPFQLAFILLNLPALTDLNHPDRSADLSAIADLLWFPTGGGKTEAYLGLTAYTLGMRRLQGVIEGRSGEHGVAVIMRYTLRLLTLQQFQRAAALICACEQIRRNNVQIWGETPFRLGLWVGQRSTPNTTEEAAQAVAQARGTNNNYAIGYGNPRQLTHCPWCGSVIHPGQNIEVEAYDKGRGRTLMYCSDRYGRCPFTQQQSKAEGLPVLVVDEEIYRLLPALLIATVDKFAQLPWKGETQMLFGQVDKFCERHGFRSPDLKDSDSHPKKDTLPKAQSFSHGPLRPPDLIIQDELHLISGPLGTLVGLYETAVDHLASWQVNGQTVRPKVIAATATIRQAANQIQALFMRTSRIFPPQGLDVEDNFFSRHRQPTPTTPGRRYLGICANGRRMKAAQIRVYLSLLASAQVLYNKYGGEADPWMTLVGYFNSMSDLGGMRNLIDDDVSNRIRRMDKRGLASRKRPRVQELTSRVSSTEIPDVLSRLERSFGLADGEPPIDVLLATNMISVGVDVRRLGLMVVSGQPKTTSEYIQATSRVGRNAPGLVCVVYNWARPRDLSHYEQFEHYHATFYQHVEALSVTPFAPRALDRGLAALLVSIIRLSKSQFNKNDSAGKVDTERHFTEAISAITRRASEVAIDSTELVSSELQKLQAYWLSLTSKHATLNYDVQRNKTLNLLKEPGRGKWEPFTCLNSMRNVEPTVQLLLTDGDHLGSPGSQQSVEDDIQEDEA